MMTNIIWTIAAIIVALVTLLFGFVTVRAIRNWDDSTTTLRHKVRGVVLLIVEIILLVFAVWVLVVHVPKVVTGVACNKAGTEQTDSKDKKEEAQGTEAPEETQESKETESPKETEDPKETEGPEETEAPAVTEDAGTTGGALNVALSVIGILLLIGALVALIRLIKKFRGRGKLHNGLLIAAIAIAIGAGSWLLIANAKQSVGVLTNGGGKNAADEAKKGASADSGNNKDKEKETEAGTETEDELPEGAFSINMSDDDLLKAMKVRFGEDFTWETYQNNFSDDLFPSRYQERKRRAQEAMRKWYGDDSKQGFSDPVWWPMEQLIEIRKSDKWEQMSVDDKLALIDGVILNAYNQILRDPRYGEQFFEMFQELAKEFPEIIERNKTWWSTLEEMYRQANDLNLKVKDADSNEITAGVSIFFEGINAAGDAKILKKEYVTSAARLCLMFDEFIVAKKPIQSPTSRINWHLAFGKDAQTVKVSALTDPDQQESEPAVIFLYRFKGETVMKVGLNVFDQRLEIFPLTEKVKEEKPAKEPEPKDNPNPGSNPDPGNNPDPGSNPDPGKNPDPGNNPTPGKTPEPSKPDPEPDKPNKTPEPDKPDKTPEPDKPDKPKQPENRLPGPNVPDEPPTNNDGDGGQKQPTKPDKKPHTPQPEQPAKQPDTKPTQKPDAPEGNGSSEGSGNKTPVPGHNDTDATVDNGDGSSTTTDTPDDKPNEEVLAPSD